MKYIVYATTNNGDGFVQKLGEYDSVEDIKIYTSALAKDVVISIECEHGQPQE